MAAVAVAVSAVSVIETDKDQLKLIVVDAVGDSHLFLNASPGDLMPKSDECSHKFGILVLLLLMIAVKGTSFAQLPQGCGGNDTNVGFEVVSVRESALTPGYLQVDENDPRSSDFTAENLLISQILGEAFQIDFRFQIVGIPDWIKQRRFQVVAKSEDCREVLQKMDLAHAKAQKQQMIQALLRDRFGLKFRIEMRMLPVDTLVQSAKGIKMVKSQGKADQPEDGYSKRTAKGVEITAKHMTVESLAGLLQGHLETTVDDETHLNGAYAFDLRFKRIQSADDAQDPTGWPPVEVALEQQLGLKLEERKRALPVLVVEHISLPTPN